MSSRLDGVWSMLVVDATMMSGLVKVPGVVWVSGLVKVADTHRYPVW